MTVFPKSWFLTKILLGILASACVAYAAPIKIIDKELLPYYDRYTFLLEQYCNKQQYFDPIKVILSVEDLETPEYMKKNGDIEIAVCNYDGTKIIKIVYDKKHYNKASETERMSTLSHEFRHCFFHIDNDGHSKKPVNYFNQYDNGKAIDLFTLYQQIIDDLQESCGGKK